jgi:hypothetical protein
MNNNGVFIQIHFSKMKRFFNRLMLASVFVSSLFILSSFTESNGSTSSVPFWGDDCYYVGIVGGMNSPCYHYYVCTRYRFWINFGSYDRYIETDCP